MVEPGWATISALARLRGVAKSAVSKRVTRLERLGALSPRPGPKGTKLVNLAEFDRAAGETTDAIREMNGRASARTQSLAEPSDPILAREQARRAAYDADLKKLDLEERLGKLLPRDKVIEAISESAQRLRQVIKQMHTRAEENAAAVAKDGVSGARAFMKSLEREQLAELARMAMLFDADWRDTLGGAAGGDEREDADEMGGHNAPTHGAREEMGGGDGRVTVPA